jgi:hypothetical protein
MAASGNLALGWYIPVLGGIRQKAGRGLSLPTTVRCAAVRVAPVALIGQGLGRKALACIWSSALSASALSAQVYCALPQPQRQLLLSQCTGEPRGTASGTWIFCSCLI